MKYSDYAKTWKGSLTENKLSRYAMMALVLSNVILAMIAFGRNETVVMIPPGIHERVEIGVSEGTPGIKEVWGTQVAMLMGNATPRNVEYISDQLGKLLSPGTFNSVQEALAAQSKRIEEENITVQFTPNQVFHLPAEDIVVVSGEYTMRGMRGAQQRMVRTYEIGVQIENYMVRVDSLKVYEGPWSANRQKDGAK
jgi:conjugal transfer pilus assembly protein TraE